MAGLQPKDKVEWRAGDTPAKSHLRRGVVKEVLPGGTCLVRTRVEGQSVVEEIRLARLRAVEAPPKKRGRKPGRPPVAKKAGRKAAKKARRRGRPRKEAASKE
ncbi:MAG: hypothetical protein PHN82_02905 [bacterium]|nr:hypothetical protein [bacterium]